MDDNNKLELLKDLYSYSEQAVFITDYNFSIIWTNGKNRAEIYKSSIPLCKNRDDEIIGSGEYDLYVNGMKFRYKLINYPNIEKGIYIIQIDEKDILFSFINYPEIYKFMENKIGIIREAIFEIVTSNNIINNSLEDNMLYNEQKYLNLNINSCFKLLRSVMNVSELINYTESKKSFIELKKVDASKNINDFVESCKSILRYSNIIIKCDLEPDLFILTDPDRFISTLLALLIYSIKSEIEKDVMLIKLYKSEKNIILTFAMESLGSGEKYENSNLLNSGLLNSADSIDSEDKIIKCYCKIFGATFMTSTNRNKSSVFTLRMPEADNSNRTVNLNSPSQDALNNRFSKFYIALSEFTKYKFY